MERRGPKIIEIDKLKARETIGYFLRWGISLLRRSRSLVSRVCMVIQRMPQVTLHTKNEEPTYRSGFLG